MLHLNRCKRPHFLQENVIYMLFWNRHVIVCKKTKQKQQHTFNCLLSLFKFSFDTCMHNHLRFRHTNTSLPCCVTGEVRASCTMEQLQNTPVEKLWTAHCSRRWRDKSLSGHSRPRRNSRVFKVNLRLEFSFDSIRRSRGRDLNGCSPSCPAAAQLAGSQGAKTRNELNSGQKELTYPSEVFTAHLGNHWWLWPRHHMEPWLKIEVTCAHEGSAEPSVSEIWCFCRALKLTREGPLFFLFIYFFSC